MISIKDKHGNILAVVKAESLAGVNLEGMDLTDANLASMDLRFSNLSRTSLHGANLKNSDLSDSTFFQADLSDADLSGSHLANTIFDYAKMINTNLADSLLVGATFRNSDLSSANLSGSDTRNASFEGATLTDTNFESSFPHSWNAIAASVWLPDHYPVGTFSRQAFRQFVAYQRFAHKWMTHDHMLIKPSKEDLKKALDKLALAKDLLEKNEAHFEKYKAERTKFRETPPMHHALTFGKEKLGNIIKSLHQHEGSAAEIKQALNSLTGIESLLASAFAKSSDKHQIDLMEPMKKVFADLGEAHKALKEYHTPMALAEKLEELKKRPKMMKYYPPTHKDDQGKATFKRFEESPAGYVDPELEKELFGYEEKMEKEKDIPKNLPPGYTT